MNEKFYDLSEEKQSQILNASYKVFATNQYKKAPTSEIAAEAGICFIIFITNWRCIFFYGSMQRI